MTWRAVVLLTLARLLRGLARIAAFGGGRLADLADALEARA